VDSSSADCAKNPVFEQGPAQARHRSIRLDGVT
jgi:hypothetical protein